MLLHPPSLTTATLFCTMCRCFEKALISTGCCRPPHYMLSKYDIIPVLSDLHWLPVNERIKFKTLLLTFKALHKQAPTYIQDLPVSLYSPPRILRSSGTLHPRWIPFYVTYLDLKSSGFRAFAAAAPDLWNSLPELTSVTIYVLLSGTRIIVSMDIFILIFIHLLFNALFVWNVG